MVEARDVLVQFKDYGGKVFTLECGRFVAQSSQITCIIGENGAGKSTLLSVLSGREKPIRGSLSVDGNQIDSRSLTNLVTWLEPGDTEHFVPNLLVRDHLIGSLVSTSISGVAFLHRLTSLGELLRRTVLPNWCIETLIPLSDRKIIELSSGQKQTLRLSMCLLQHRKIILADESTSNLDVRNSRLFLETFRDTVVKAGFSAIVVTHDLFVAAEYSHRIYYMTQGRVRPVNFDQGVTTDERVYILRRLVDESYV